MNKSHHYPDKLKYLIESYELNFAAGNVLKYIVRCYLKDKEKDIDKAIDYVKSDWCIESFSYESADTCIHGIKGLTKMQEKAIFALSEYLFKGKPKYFYKDKLLESLYNLKKEILDGSK